MNIEEKEDIKEKIADAFKKHFNYFGFKKTSVDDVAKELKVSKKTIYQIFTSKEKIFYYIVTRIAIGIKIGMEKDLQKFQSENEKLGYIIVQIFDKSKNWLKKNDAFEFRYKYEIGSLAFKDAFKDLLVKIVKSGMEKGEFKQAPLEIKVRFIEGVISGGMDMIAQNPDQEVVEDVIDSVLKMLK
ncbi:MAG: TetR/AcrR family transcriptional regulator [Actinobacteria bacterium]|nr:TetR/AcrR family transcriptional regulator [Actinomycetota bacterium]